MNTPRRLVLGLILLCAPAALADAKEETMKLLLGRWEIKRKLSDREVRKKQPSCQQAQS